MLILTTCGLLESMNLFFFFFKQKTAYEMRISDWSSDVCSSDLPQHVAVAVVSRNRLDALLASLRAHDLEPDVLVPEPLLLPWHAGVAMVLVDANRALLRYGEARAFVGRPDDLHM